MMLSIWAAGVVLVLDALFASVLLWRRGLRWAQAFWLWLGMSVVGLFVLGTAVAGVATVGGEGGAPLVTVGAPVVAAALFVAARAGFARRLLRTPEATARISWIGAFAISVGTILAATGVVWLLRFAIDVAH